MRFGNCKNTNYTLFEDFSEDLSIDFDKYGRAQQMQICNVILYGLIYNLRKYNCQGLVDII